MIDNLPFLISVGTTAIGMAVTTVMLWSSITQWKQIPIDISTMHTVETILTKLDQALLSDEDLIEANRQASLRLRGDRRVSRIKRHGPERRKSYVS